MGGDSKWQLHMLMLYSERFKERETLIEELKCWVFEYHQKIFEFCTSQQGNYGVLALAKYSSLYLSSEWLFASYGNILTDVTLYSSNIFWNHANGRVLNKEFYTCRMERLFFLHLFTELFHEDFSSLIRTNTAGLFNNPQTLYTLRGKVYMNCGFWEQNAVVQKSKNYTSIVGVLASNLTSYPGNPGLFPGSGKHLCVCECEDLCKCSCSHAHQKWKSVAGLLAGLNRVIIKVLEYQYWWLAGGYDLEIWHFGSG